jgi:hypothetical protein
MIAQRRRNGSRAEARSHAGHSQMMKLPAGILPSRYRCRRRGASDCSVWQCGHSKRRVVDPCGSGGTRSPPRRTSSTLGSPAFSAPVHAAIIPPAPPRRRTIPAARSHLDPRQCLGRLAGARRVTSIGGETNAPLQNASERSAWRHRRRGTAWRCFAKRGVVATTQRCPRPRGRAERRRGPLPLRHTMAAATIADRPRPTAGRGRCLAGPDLGRMMSRVLGRKPHDLLYPSADPQRCSALQPAPHDRQK